ncbi:MAG TPA: DEAD/DEAH box helicase, partial [Microbacteriaceae bacterium]|nr:DEAD/DEAH box helicase [Microbacteriaceae bacterium]
MSWSAEIPDQVPWDPDEVPWDPDEQVPPDDEPRYPSTRQPTASSGHRSTPGAASPHVGADPLDVLHTVFGYDEFRGNQAAVIRQLIGGGDAVVLMPTGGGKSLCYQIPSLVREGT